MNGNSIDVPFGAGDVDISNYESDNSGQHLFISDESDSNHETDYLGKSIRGKIYKEEGFKFVRDKNDKKKIRAHCGSLACSWRIHASVLPDGVTYMIKNIGTDHTSVRGRKNVEANSTWIAQKLRSRFRADPQIKLEVLHAKVLEKYGVDVSRMSLYRTKRKALEVNAGSHLESYGKLWKYGAEIKKTNPSSLAKVELYEINNLNPNLSFKRFFISFAANHVGFKDGCRPFIGLDGRHLKGPFGCVLLSAAALDGNYGLFSIAYDVVEAENKDISSTMSGPKAAVSPTSVQQIGDPQGPSYNASNGAI
ncbi:uncharacterized protein LOC132309727 [Cornus florida]|uniref:uncharacterized protein LOC132309727 n=1 Tax=Cornus florida TaxID=4283 RepID=UPI0028A120CE|nr:uncharacterized protein LOC132309727 [Cornus florida]